MRNLLSVFVLALCSFHCSHGQSTLEGRLLSLSDQQPLIYANVGLVACNLGTVTDVEGRFVLTIPDSLRGKEIRFSQYGFEPYSMVVSAAFFQQAEGGLLIYMTEHVQDQEEMTVRAPELKQKELGRKSENGTITVGFLSYQLGSEMGSVIDVKRRSYVEDFNFGVYATGYDTLVFRINFFACDKKGVPTDSLLTKSVVFGWNPSMNGMVSIDLKEEYITLKQDALLSLEIVGGEFSNGEIGKRSVQFAAKLMGGTYARQTSQSAWEEVPVVTPAFYITVQQEVGK